MDHHQNCWACCTHMNVMLHLQRLQNSLNYVNPESNSTSQCIR
jgi:hypothetical protein